jgi:hypothetical protein
MHPNGCEIEWNPECDFKVYVPDGADLLVFFLFLQLHNELSAD